MSDGIGRGAAVMASGTAVSRLLGLLRGMVLVAAVGATGQAADAFAVANKLPNVLYMLLAGGLLNAVLVPQVVRAYKREDGQHYVDRLMTLGVLALAGMTLVLTLAAPLLVRIYSTPGVPAQQTLAIAFAYWCIPQLFFYGLYALLGQVLIARSSFAPYTWAPVVNNIVSIAGFAVFIVVFGTAKAGDVQLAQTWTAGKVALLAGAATLGVVAQALVLLPALRRAGVHLRPRFGLRGSGLGRAGNVAMWTLVGLGIGQLGYVVVSRVASSAPAAADQVVGIAGNAAYDYAFLIFMLPHSLVTVSIATALFTRLAGQAHDQDVDAVRASLSLGLRAVGLFTVLATAVIGVLVVPITSLVLLTASGTDASAVALVVVAMILGLTMFGAWSICQRVFYAYEDARGLVPIQLAMAGVVVLGTLAFRALVEPRYWVAGAGLSMSVSYGVGAVVALVLLRRRLGSVDGPRVLRVHVQALVAAVVAALVGGAVLAALVLGLHPTGVLGLLLQVAVVAPVIVAVYVGLLRLMRVSELDRLVRPVMARLRPVLDRIRRRPR